MALETAGEPQIPGPGTAPDGRTPGIASRVHRWADRPLASGLAGFSTTVLVMLPIEYEAPLRTLMLLLSARRSL